MKHLHRAAKQHEEHKSHRRSGLLHPRHHQFTHPKIGLFFGAFFVIGAVIVYFSQASSLPVFHDNVDYWRPRVAGCEAGSGPSSTPNYQAANASGHYGAYQFDVGTWRSNVSADVAAQYPTAREAPPAIQDAAFNSAFSRRGTQPWNASYHCWIRGADVGSVVAPQPANPVAALVQQVVAPPPPPAGSYNVTVSGFVTFNGQGVAGATIQTCADNPSATTSVGGQFSLRMPAGKDFCVRVSGGVPAGAKLSRTNNQPEHATAPSYEYQRAGQNLYHSLFNFLAPYYSWDRSVDTGYNFYYNS